MKRAVTKIGDIFSVKISDEKKKYFQLVAFDLTQLNSDVIRAFKRDFPLGASPDLLKIVSEEVDFYAHCSTKLGLKMNLWEKVGNTLKIGDVSQVLFRDTSDYGSKLGDEPVKVSQNWHIWRINDKGFSKVGKLEGENRRAYVGIVINPLGIIELLMGNKYPIYYPDYE